MKKSAWLMALGAGILWGSMGLFVRVYNARNLQTLDVVEVRCITTVVMMAVFLFFYDRQLFRIRLKDLWCFLGTGLLSIVFFNFCYFRTITLTSLSVAAALLYTAPAIVMVMSALLFKEKLNRIKLIAVVLTVIGCMFVSGMMTSADTLSPAGILLGLGSGLGYALYSIFSRFALEKGYHPFTICFYTFLTAGIGILPLANLSLLGDVCLAGGSMALFSLAFGLVSTVLPYLIYTISLRYLENGHASILASVEPLTATALGILLYKEVMSWDELLGMLLILGAILLCNMKIEPAGGKKKTVSP